MTGAIPWPGVRTEFVTTDRLATRVLSSGDADGEPVLFVHGNLSSSVFWEETMLALPSGYRAAAADLRGYGESDRRSVIDATRGVRDWAEDLIALADALAWPRFHLVAHSLGGCVAWRLLADWPQRLRSVTLAAPGPPCGFGGARGPRGELNHADGAGSGAGLVHPEWVRRLRAGEREITHEFLSPRAVMNRLYWNPPFRAEREETLLTAMLSVHLGERHYPGDQTESPHWPGFAPGRYGPINAISPLHNQDLSPKLASLAGRLPPLLWVQGTADPIICDESPSDPAVQGRAGLRPDWPGVAVFPPQPFRSQVAAAVESYRQAGGQVRRVDLACGHTPYLEQPAAFSEALQEQLRCGSAQ